MPQTSRKKPFSGKAKKQQLQAKKQSNTMTWLNKMPSMDDAPMKSTVTNVHGSTSSNTGRNGSGRNRYALRLHQESREELEAKRLESYQSLNPVMDKDLEVDPSEYFPDDITFPKRPEWSYSMSKAEVDARENKALQDFLSELESSPHWKDISYFELNLETWRQLWRVTEMCDILLLIVDVRYAGMMFPPALYHHIVREQRKSMMVVLNKIDLVPASVVAAWQRHLRDNYPGLHVVYFTSCPGYNLRANYRADDPNCRQEGETSLKIRRRKGRQRMCIEGATKVLEACKDIVGDKVDLSSWEQKILEESAETTEDDQKTQVGSTIDERPDTSYYEHEWCRHGVLTVGCVGQPNAGKSSLLNALMGRKVVSVSRTPGHTKHFQTIFLTPNVRLCDCPGLVFPSKVPRHIQILMGSYPIAQVREPFAVIRYLAERLDLPRMLNMAHPDNDTTWSARDVCDAWAKKNGYYTAHAARLDSNRAANSLLRMALDGKICLWLRPPGYTDNREEFETCEEIKYIKWVQALSKDAERGDAGSSPGASTSSDDDDGDDNEDPEEDNVAITNRFAALLASD